MPLDDVDETDAESGWRVRVTGALAAHPRYTHAGHINHAASGATGRLWFQANVLTGFDSVFVLPLSVIAAVRRAGYGVAPSVFETVEESEAAMSPAVRGVPATGAFLVAWTSRDVQGAHEIHTDRFEAIRIADFHTPRHARVAAEAVYDAVRADPSTHTCSLAAVLATSRSGVDAACALPCSPASPE